MTLRTGPPVVPVLPAASVVSTNANGAGAMNSTPAAGPDAHAAQPQHGHHHGHRLGAPRNGGTPMHGARHRPPPPRAPQPGRAATNSRAAGPADFDEDGIHQSDEDQLRRMEARAKTPEDRGDQNSDGGSNNNEGKRKERQFAAVIGKTAMNRLSLQTWDGVSNAERSTLAGTAASLVAITRGTQAALPGIGVQLGALMAARRWMATSGKGDARVTLAAVRDVLQSLGPPKSMPVPSAETHHVWLPVFLLNLHKPRTASQQQQAADTLALLERMTGRTKVDGHGN